MNIEAVIHKNWLPIGVNFQQRTFSPVGVQFVFGRVHANGTEATWGFYSGAHSSHKASCPFLRSACGARDGRFSSKT